jgi:hypothetical protein
MYNKHLIAKMLGELFRRIFSAILILFRTEQSPLKYDMKIVRTSVNEALRSATLLGLTFTGIMIILIALIQGLEKPTILLAAIFLSMGLGQQIISVVLDVVITDLRAYISNWNSVLYILARMKKSLEWRFIENEAHIIFIYPYITFSIPPKLSLKPGVNDIVNYINCDRDDVMYPKNVDKEVEQLVFASHALEQLKERLEVHHQLYEIEQKTGAINPILFIALGTILWLLSS